MDLVPTPSLTLASPPRPRDGASGRRKAPPAVPVHEVGTETAVELAISVEAATRSVQAMVVPVIVPIHHVQPRARSEGLARVLNVLIASVALVLLIPVMFLIALAVKLTSPGPVFYTQTRVGLDRRAKDRRGRGAPPQGPSRRASDRRATNYGGTVFTIYKFRTMVVDAEREGVQWASKNDSRVTPIGMFLRRMRLDEIPQLWNVVRGDMNIVGPRPERPTIVLELCQHIPHYPMRHRAKPGITGWAQINHSYDSCIDDVRTKVRYDLEYLQRQGMVEDFKIMARTVPVMLFRKGSQ